MLLNTLILYKITDLLRTHKINKHIIASFSSFIYLPNIKIIEQNIDSYNSSSIKLLPSFFLIFSPERTQKFDFCASLSKCQKPSFFPHFSTHFEDILDKFNFKNDCCVCVQPRSRYFQRTDKIYLTKKLHRS